MADVMVSTDRMLLGRWEKAAVFTVEENGAAIGELHLSKGAVRYFPAGHEIPVRLTWRQFDILMRKKKA